MIKLHKFQKECVDDLEREFKRNRAVCLSLYTGAGKTNVFLEFCRKQIEKNPDLKIGIALARRQFWTRRSLVVSNFVHHFPMKNMRRMTAWQQD